MLDTFFRAKIITGILFFFFQTGARFYELYEQLLPLSPFGNTSTNYAQHSYDATWTFARALNKTLTGTALKITAMLGASLHLVQQPKVSSDRGVFFADYISFRCI